MRDTAIFLNSYRTASGAVQAPAAARVVFDPLALNPRLGDGYAQRAEVANETVMVAPGVSCRFHNWDGKHGAGVRILTDPILADGERVRAVVQSQMEAGQRVASDAQPAAGGTIKFDPLCNAHQVSQSAVGDLITALRTDAEINPAGSDVCSRLAFVLERGPRGGSDDA